MLQLAALFGIVFLLGAVPNLIPATAVVVAFALRDDVGAVAAVIVGTAAVTLGRVTLALAVRHGFERLHRGPVAANIEYLHEWLEGRKRTHLVLSCALAVPGCPSTTVFVAAGALRLHLAPLAAGFAAGRAAWYTAAVVIAGSAASGIESLIRRGLNPWLIALAFVLVIAPLFVLSRIEWRALLQERRIRLIPRRPPGADSGGTGE